MDDVNTMTPETLAVIRRELGIANIISCKRRRGDIYLELQNTRQLLVKAKDRCSIHAQLRDGIAVATFVKDVLFYETKIKSLERALGSGE